MQSLYSKIEKSMPQKQAKVPLYMKIDEDVLLWFKKQGKGYQQKINHLLRGYMEYSADRIDYAQELFNQYYTQCFWHMRQDLKVTEALIPTIIAGLKKFGGREGFLAADKLSK
jgi:hypothetical protein